jgi:hypothetical protein
LFLLFLGVLFVPLPNLHTESVRKKGKIKSSFADKLVENDINANCK